MIKHNNNNNHNKFVQCHSTGMAEQVTWTARSIALILAVTAAAATAAAVGIGVVAAGII